MEFEIEKKQISKELYLAILLSAGKPTEFQIEQAGALAEEIDKEAFEKIVISNRIHGLVMENIRRTGLFPAGECQKMEELADRHTLEAMRLSGELIRIKKLFRSGGIRMMLIKGPVLGMELYGNVTCRVSHDLDILVSREDYRQAADLLRSAGFETEQQYTARQMEQVLRVGHHEEFRSKDGIIIELHWRLDEAMALEIDDIWKERRELHFFGEYIAVPGAADEALYLMHHGVQHGFYRIKWLLDIAEIIKQGKTDWNAVFRKAGERGSIFEVLTCVILCYSIRAFDLPDMELGEIYIDTVRQKRVMYLRQRDSGQISEALKSAEKMLAEIDDVINLAGETEAPGETPVYGRYLHTYLREYGKWKGNNRGTWLLGKMRPGLRDFRRFQIPDKLYFIYYIIRPFYWVYWKMQEYYTQQERKKG